MKYAFSTLVLLALLTACSNEPGLRALKNGYAKASGEYAQGLEKILIDSSVQDNLLQSVRKAVVSAGKIRLEAARRTGRFVAGSHVPETVKLLDCTKQLPALTKLKDDKNLLYTSTVTLVFEIQARDYGVESDAWRRFVVTKMVAVDRDGFWHFPSYQALLNEAGTKCDESAQALLREVRRLRQDLEMEPLNPVLRRPCSG